VLRQAACVVCVGVGNLVITTGHQKQEEEVKKTVQIKESKAKRRKILPCGVLREKRTEQNERATLFQVRQIHVRYHSSCYRYDIYTYVITAILQVRHVHVCYHSLHFRYDIYTTLSLFVCQVRYTLMKP
jgi:hypothetical protein